MAASQLLARNAMALPRWTLSRNGLSRASCSSVVLSQPALGNHCSVARVANRTSHGVAVVPTEMCLDPFCYLTHTDDYGWAVFAANAWGCLLRAVVGFRQDRHDRMCCVGVVCSLDPLGSSFGGEMAFAFQVQV
jgi:hypothetical protein